MKANELMIGDWVQNTCGHKGKVIGFRYYTTDKDNEIVIAYKPNNTTWSNSTLIQPIPITEEILKANGFILKGKTSAEDNDIYYCVYVDKDNNAFEIHYRHCDGQLRIFWKNYLFGITYVHELQHSLRLCGLHEMADNLKIQ